jgi:hypothetical protein
LHHTGVLFYSYPFNIMFLIVHILTGLGSTRLHFHLVLLLSSLPRVGVLYGTFDHLLPPLPDYFALDGGPHTEWRIIPVLLLIDYRSYS